MGLFVFALEAGEGVFFEPVEGNRHVDDFSNSFDVLKGSVDPAAPLGSGIQLQTMQEGKVELLKGMSEAPRVAFRNSLR